MGLNQLLNMLYEMKKYCQITYFAYDVFGLRKHIQIINIIIIDRKWLK